MCEQRAIYTYLSPCVWWHVSVKSHSPYKLFQLVYLETVLGYKHFLFQSKWKKNVLIYYLFFKTRKLEYTRGKKNKWWKINVQRAITLKMNLHKEGHDTYAVFFSNGILVVLEQRGIPMNQLHLKNTLKLDRLNSFTYLWNCRIWNIFLI